MKYISIFIVIFSSKKVTYTIHICIVFKGTKQHNKLISITEQINFYERFYKCNKYI